MNKERRAALDAISEQLSNIEDALEDFKIQEEDYFDNMPENVKGGKKGEEAKNAICKMANAISSIQEAKDYINSSAE